ncbi:MAG TPA: signal peptidase I [Solirubrobacteraceae bacterium]|nr:signal peptidase I [Solirubrobacteraceae bacterium]
MLLKAIVGVAVLILAFAILVGRPHFKRYRLPSESMAPTLSHGDVIAVSGADDLKVGDVVVFNPPEGAAGVALGCGSATPANQLCERPEGGRAPTVFIKRIVAGPGDEIAFDDGHAVLNGKRQREPFIKPCLGDGCYYPKPITVRLGSYYMAGDNRGASDDSRFWGPVPQEWILGRAVRCRAIYFFCSPV